MSCEASFCSAPFCSSDNSWSEFQPCLVLLHLITNRKEWKYIYMLNRSLSRIHVYSINIYIYIQYDNRCRKSYHDHYIVQSIIIILIKTYIFSFDSTHRSSLIVFNYPSDDQNFDLKTTRHVKGAKKTASKERKVSNSE